MKHTPVDDPHYSLRSEVWDLLWEYLAQQPYQYKINVGEVVHPFIDALVKLRVLK